MAYLVMVMLLVCAVAVVMFLWNPPETPAGGDATAGAAGHDGGGAPTPTTLEGTLVAQLLGGEISGDQYAQAQARLAARDDELSPLSVPDDDLPEPCG